MKTDNLVASPFFNVMAFSVVWAVQIFFSKSAFLAGAQVIPFVVQSTISAAVFLTAYIFLLKPKKLRELTKDVFFWLVLANVFHNGLGSLLSNLGVSLTTAINAGFLMQFTTVTTSSLAWLILRERMTASKLVTIVVIMVGTYLLITKGQLIVPHVGDILILLACLSWSSGNVLVRRVLKQHPIDVDVAAFLRPLSGLPLLFLFISLSPLYSGNAKILFQANIFDLRYFGYAAANGVLAATCWLFLNRTLKVASASYMTMMSSMTPVIVAVLAIVFLGERLIPVQWLGVVLISGSGLVTQLLKVEKH